MRTLTVNQISLGTNFQVRSGVDPVAGGTILHEWGFVPEKDDQIDHVAPRRDKRFSVDINEGCRFELFEDGVTRHSLCQGTASGYHADTPGSKALTFYADATIAHANEPVELSLSVHCD